MGYKHIDNLYKNSKILAFRECYALEKIHGKSAHISWLPEQSRFNFFTNGKDHKAFVNLFDVPTIQEKFLKFFLPITNVTIFGEEYGTYDMAVNYIYGDDLKFIAFEVQIDGHWLDVPKAESVCKKLGIEFVHYDRTTTDLESLDKLRDADSVQAVRNGMGEGKPREGIVLRPIFEVRLNNDERIIAKYKRAEFEEIKSPRPVSMEELKVLEDAQEIAEEWVTEMRLVHVLDNFPVQTNLKSTPKIIAAMIEDVYREAKGEIVESKEVERAIGTKTVELFKKHLLSLNSPILEAQDKLLINETNN